MFSHKAPKGYRVGDLHPTHKGAIHEQARQKEPSIPNAGRYTGFKAMVQYSDGGLQGERDGATDGEGGQDAPSAANTQ